MITCHACGFGHRTSEELAACIKSVEQLRAGEAAQASLRTPPPDIEELCFDLVCDARVDGDVVSLLVPRVIWALCKHGLLLSPVKTSPRWQPIETAPKDADVVLLYREGWGVQPGYWYDMVGSGDDGPPRWIATETQGLSGGTMGDGPTHWMPLPQAPERTSGAVYAVDPGAASEGRESLRATSASSSELSEVGEASSLRTALEPLPEAIARRAHADQKDTVTGEPYIHHVERVVALVETPDEKAVAWLHDVLEDVPLPAAALRIAGVPEPIVDAVVVLTRTGDRFYAAYIDTVVASGNRLALAVKRADLLDHLRPNCPPNLRARYERALLHIEAALRESHP